MIEAPAALAWQALDARRNESSFQEPMRGAGRQYEQAALAMSARLLLDVLEQPFAVAHALHFRRDDQASHFG